MTRTVNGTGQLLRKVESRRVGDASALLLHKFYRHRIIFETRFVRQVKKAPIDTYLIRPLRQAQTPGGHVRHTSILHEYFATTLIKFTAEPGVVAV